MWDPSLSEDRLFGEEQAPQSAACVESSLHWRDATPDPLASLPEKLKLAVELLERACGPESIEVFGAVVSIVQVKAAGV